MKTPWLFLLLSLASTTACGPDEPAKNPEPAIDAFDEPPGEPALPEPSATWWKEKSPCPEGATMKGAAPPEGKTVWCERADGTKHGPFASFFDNGKKQTGLVYR